MNDLSLLQDFINEATEHLDELEKNLLQLESDPENKEILNEIFRSIHTIKGASEYLAMDKIADLSHKLENLLDLLRLGKKKVDSDIIMFLFKSNDRIGRLITEIDKTGAEKSDIQDLIEKLETMETDNSTGTSSDKHSICDTETKAPVSSVYEEEYDKELFSIYIKQLELNLKLFIDLLTGLGESDSSQDTLEECLELAENMKSSANYMGYEKLIQVYDFWIEKLNNRNLSSDTERIGLYVKPGIDTILEIFPVLNTDEFQKITSALLNQNKEVQSEDTRENFDSVIDDMFADMLPETEPSSEPAVSDYPATCIYEEDHDRELFSIFIEQFRENIDELMTEAGAAALSDDYSESVEHCRRIVNKLKSSALYMGYDELCGYYDFWLERLKNVMDRLEDGQNVTVDAFIDTEIIARIDGALNYFQPGIIDDKSNFESPLKTSINDHYTVEKTQVTDTSELYDQLSSAFDSRQAMYQIGDNDLSIQEMEKELFSFPDINDDEFIKSDTENTPETGFEKSLSDSDNNIMPSIEDPDIKQLPSGQIELPESIEAPEERADRIIQKSVRVDAEKIDSLMNQVGELVVSRAWFSQLFNEIKTLQFDLVQNNTISPKEIKQFRNFSFKLSEATTSLGRLANELQEGVMKVRMLPIERLFNRLPRQIRDLAQRSQKEVELILKGEETELDKMVIEKISDPLIHIIRNAVDHGIEMPDERKKIGKPLKGRIALEAYHESNHVVIEISDDGKGLNRALIANKALNQKVISKEELDLMSDREIHRLILRPGFSTAEKVTQTSGRGVGMDVVKKNIEKLNGIIDIYSVEGKETRFRIKIPLTLAIIPALLVKVESELFTIPLSTVEETLKLNTKDISTIEGMEVMQIRNDTLPIVRLGNLFRITPRTAKSGSAFVVVVNNGVKKTGLVVDDLLGQEEVVIKPLEDYLQEKSGFSGATILGDGSISLILDIYELVNISVRRQKARKEALMIS